MGGSTKDLDALRCRCGPLYLRYWDNRNDLVHDDWVGPFHDEGILE
jgi:hypothetical protein